MNTDIGFDMALDLELCLKGLSMSVDRRKRLLLFATQANAFHIYLKEQKEKCMAHLVEAEELRDNAVEIDNEVGIMEADDMCDRFLGDVKKAERAICRNKGKIIKVKQRLSIADDTVRDWCNAWEMVVVNVAEHLHRVRHHPK